MKDLGGEKDWKSKNQSERRKTEGVTEPVMAEPYGRELGDDLDIFNEKG